MNDLVHAELRRVAQHADFFEPIDRTIRELLIEYEDSYVICVCDEYVRLATPREWGVIVSDEAARWRIGQCVCRRILALGPAPTDDEMAERCELELRRYEARRADGSL